MKDIANTFWQKQGFLHEFSTDIGALGLVLFVGRMLAISLERLHRIHRQGKKCARNIPCTFKILCSLVTRTESLSSFASIRSEDLIPWNGDRVESA